MNYSDPSRPTPDWARSVDKLIDDLRDTLGWLPFDPTPERLYRADELYEGFANGGFAATMDQASYALARKAGGPRISPEDDLSQRLHDHGITLALDEFRADRRVVGVMGGHALQRGSEGYRQCVALGRALAQAGACVVTGGGPGAMEASNFGAATSNLAMEEVEPLIDQLAAAPDFDEADAFIGTALEVLSQIDEPVINLSVPTWFYGHEPANPFATHIAKYFSNSEREDGLLAIATGGIVFVQGGPGTLQEVFQDAAQNAYETFGPPSPMVFLGPPSDPDWWTASGVYGGLNQAFTSYDGSRRPGWDRVALAGSVVEVLDALAAYPDE